MSKLVLQRVYCDNGWLGQPFHDSSFQLICLFRWIYIIVYINIKDISSPATAVQNIISVCALLWKVIQRKQKSARHLLRVAWSYEMVFSCMVAWYDSGFSLLLTLYNIQKEGCCYAGCMIGVCIMIFIMRNSWLLSDNTKSTHKGNRGLSWVSLVKLIFNFLPLAIGDSQLRPCLEADDVKESSKQWYTFQPP